MKMFERAVRRKLVANLDVCNPLLEGQHGFGTRRSCLTDHLSYYDNILDQLEEGKGVDVVYTDFAKAFDKCQTGVLCKMGCWLAAFLNPLVRKQTVGVEGRLSDLMPVLPGVPQGIVLAPAFSLFTCWAYQPTQ